MIRRICRARLQEQFGTFPGAISEVVGVGARAAAKDLAGLTELVQ